jgi:Alpha/beta hydrolase domain
LSRPTQPRSGATGTATLGGIRLPHFAVPIRQYSGRNDGDMPEVLFGCSRPFTAAELHQLYPNREAYPDHWQAALDRGGTGLKTVTSAAP